VKELIRSNDPVRLSFLTALLADAGIGALVLDTHSSVMQGSIDILPQRLMVADDDLEDARRLLIEAEQVAADHVWR
jgi:Tfp pilus assembly protein PilN